MEQYDTRWWETKETEILRNKFNIFSHFMYSKKALVCFFRNKFVNYIISDPITAVKGPPNISVSNMRCTESQAFTRPLTFAIFSHKQYSQKHELLLHVTQKLLSKYCQNKGEHSNTLKSYITVINCIFHMVILKISSSSNSSVRLTTKRALANNVNFAICIKKCVQWDAGLGNCPPPRGLFAYAGNNDQ